MLTSILLALMINFQSVAPKPKEPFTFTTTKGTAVTVPNEPNVTIYLGIDGYKGEIKFSTSDTLKTCHLNDIKKILEYTKEQLPPTPIKENLNFLNLSDYIIGSNAIYRYSPCDFSATIECRIIKIQETLKEAEAEKALKDKVEKQQDEMRKLLDNCSFIMEKQ